MKIWFLERVTVNHLTYPALSCHKRPTREDLSNTGLLGAQSLYQMTNSFVNKHDILSRLWQWIPWLCKSASSWEQAKLKKEGGKNDKAALQSGSSSCVTYITQSFCHASRKSPPQRLAIWTIQQPACTFQEPRHNRGVGGSNPSSLYCRCVPGQTLQRWSLCKYEDVWIYSWVTLVAVICVGLPQ